MNKRFSLWLLILLLSNFWACRKAPLPEPSTPETFTVVELPSTPEYEIEGSAKARFFDDSYVRAHNPHLRHHSANFRSDSDLLLHLRYLIDHQDDQDDFIASLGDSLGYPLWSNAEVWDNFVLLPWVKINSELTEAVLVVKVEGGYYDFKLLLRNRIYSNILTNNVHLNYVSELEVFRAFDHLLFEREDRLLRRALMVQAPGLSTFRCPANYYWTCAEWIVPFGEPNEGTVVSERSNPCGSTCADCVLFVYVPEDCLENHAPPGWGNTDGRDVPPSRGGSSGYGGGGGNTPPGNPSNWWEERNYPVLLQSILADLELPVEDAFVAECLARNFALQGLVRDLLDHTVNEECIVSDALNQRLAMSCTCDDFDHRGAEQCDEVQSLRESFALYDGSGWCVNRTCKESFNFVETGIGYTAEVNDIHQTYLSASAGFYSYYIGVMCIQVNGVDAFGNSLTAEKAAELSAFAMDNARAALFNQLGNTIHTNVEAHQEYKSLIVQELRILTGGGTTSSVAYGACVGNIPSTEYRVNPLGVPICIDLF